MISELLKSGVPGAHSNARQRVEGKVDLPRLFRAIDADPAIAGAGVVYIESDFTVVTLREFQVICSIVPKKVILREAPRYMAPLEFARALETQPRESRLVAELVSMGLACSAAYLSWVVVRAGSVLIPFTSGASSIIAFIGLSAASASSAQCLIGGTRVAIELVNPKLNDRLDSKEWYQGMVAALDDISLLGAGASGYTTLRVTEIIKLAINKNFRQVLKGMSRQERAKLTKNVLAIKNPSLTRKLIKLKQATKELPKSFSENAINQSTMIHIKDSVAATLSFSGSAFSGNVNALAIGLYEEAR
ncbi:NAD synthetase [Pseudomonas agarici]|uniref:NAD synthetase n=2 Tax=Pseudomonas agarici TaxID=46677 RepID=UPI00094329C9|nr:NAD synthetase [Pseudomonas agarici]NWC11448.1 NAD synthetase [Pseudomonas agarici]